MDNTVKRHKSKQKQKDCYENFATVQEHLANKPPTLPTSQSSKMIGLLSVTTVWMNRNKFGSVERVQYVNRKPKIVNLKFFNEHLTGFVQISAAWRREGKT